MNEANQYVVFTLNGQRYALPLTAVERTIRVVQITPLPKAPDIVIGIINVQGQVVPVLNIRRRFRFPERGLELSDQLIVARTRKRTVALVVDDTLGVTGGLEKNTIVSAGKILPNLEYVDGVIKLEDGMILIHDLDRFLALDEEKTLDDALSGRG